jgi:hypothetical protein
VQPQDRLRLGRETMPIAVAMFFVLFVPSVVKTNHHKEDEGDEGDGVSDVRSGT